MTFFELGLKAADNPLVSAFQRFVDLCNSLHLLQKVAYLTKSTLFLSIKISIYNIVKIILVKIQRLRSSRRLNLY